MENWGIDFHEAKNMLNAVRIFLASTLSAIVMQYSVASNVSGTTKSIPTMTPVQTIVYAINNSNTSDTTKAKSSPITGQFSMNLPAGNYTLEAIANHHQDWIETNFVVGGDTSLDLRLIRGEYDNGTPILVDTMWQENHSILKFAKGQYERNDINSQWDVVNWPSTRRRLYIDPTMDSLSRKNLDSVLQRNTAGSFGTRYYDIQPIDSAEGGISILFGTPSAGDAYTDIGIKTVSESPLLRNIIGAAITIRSDLPRPIPKRIFADELSHAEDQSHHSIWPYHVLTRLDIPSLATETSDDELYISAINQTQLAGSNWRNQRDTIKSIPQSFVVAYADGWNLASVPTTEADMRAIVLFAEKTSSAFIYDGGYKQEDTLKGGQGFWLKFNNALEKEFNGQPKTTDTAKVNDRWNIVGFIGYRMPVDSLRQEPDGIIQSNFFGYDNGYHIVDTLEPGRGYWVKTNQPGMIIATKPGMGSQANYKNYPRNIDVSEIPDTPSQVTEVKENIPAYPREFALSENYPNPFNPATIIHYDLPTSSHVRLTVYDVLGREVAMLVNELEQPGSKSVEFNATNLPSGVYFYRLEAGTFSATKKLLLLR